jgi:hypothetical protein
MGCKYVKDFEFGSDKGYTGSAGKQEVKTYLRGGSVKKASPAGAKTACANGCSVEMKKGGKTKKAAPKKVAAKKSAKRSDKAEDAMVEQVLAQMLSQAGQTGRMPGVPELGSPMQGMPMPAPNARAVPVAPQAPMIPMRDGGKMGRKSYC